MTRNCTLSIFLLGALCHVCAQAPARSLFESLPLWPADGKPGPEMTGKYVFRDPATEEVVISYPTDPKDPRGPRTTYRYRPNNQVEGRIVTEISTSEGLYEYRYTVSNGPTAREGINKFYLVGPGPEADIQVHHSVWGKLRSEHSAMKQAAAFWAPAGNAIQWSPLTIGREIAPGARATGFSIVSSYRPGFTTAYLAGGGALTTSGGDLPIEVTDQLIPLLKLEVDCQVVLALGPRFGNAVAQREIVRDYEEGLRQLVKLGVLSASSAFVRQMTALLQSCASDAPSCLESPSAEVLRVVEPGLEREIATAFRLALAPARQ